MRIQFSQHRTERAGCSLFVAPTVGAAQVDAVLGDADLARFASEPFDAAREAAFRQHSWPDHYARHALSPDWTSPSCVHWARILAVAMRALFADQDLARLHYRACIAREMAASNGIGSGFALPHVQSPILSAPLLCAIRLQRGLAFPFRAIDGLPVHTMVLALGARQQTGSFMRMLATISRLFREYRAKLDAASDEEYTAILVEGL